MAESPSPWQSVRENYVILKKTVTVDDDFVKSLAGKAVITPEEKENILELINPHKMSNCLFRDVLPKKKDRKAFRDFVDVLMAAGNDAIAQKLKKNCKATTQPLIETSVETEKVGTEAVEEKDLSSILSGNLKALQRRCSLQEIDTQEFRSISQFRTALLGRLGAKHSDERASEAVLERIRASFCELDKRRDEFVKICEKLQLLKECEEPALNQLKIPKMSFWLQPSDLKKQTERVRNGKPRLLVAGSTSAGKSTLVNALLGEAILPMSYNASTAAICEIQYSETGEKRAVVTMEHKGKTFDHEIDLSNEDGKQLLCEMVSTSDDRIKTDNSACKFGVIYWPSEFLKAITLVDSPGVTEKWGEFSLARKITESFQKKHASGFVYVLDARRSAQEAGEVGGLLTTLASSLPSLIQGSLFVINKWDVFVERQPEKTKQDEYKNLVKRQISGHLKAFDVEDRFITMNAKLAFQLQCLGSQSPDMAKFRKKLTEILPLGLDSFIVSEIKPIYDEIDGITLIAENIVRNNDLSKARQTQKFNDHSALLVSFLKSVRSGDLFHITAMTNEEIRKLAKRLDQYLSSREGLSHALGSIDASVSADPRVVAESRFHDTVAQFYKFNSFFSWVEEMVKPPVNEFWDKFQRFKLSLAGSPARPCSAVDHHNSYLSFALRLTVMVVKKTVANFTYGLSSLFSTSASPIHAPDSIYQAYSDLLKSKKERLFDEVSNLVIQSRPCLQLLFEEIPASLHDAENYLSYVNDHDLFKFAKPLLKLFRDLRERAAYFQLSMDVHHKFSFRDFSDETPCNYFQKILIEDGKMSKNFFVKFRTKDEESKVNTITFGQMFTELHVLQSFEIKNNHLLLFAGTCLKDSVTVGYVFQEHGSSLAFRFQNESRSVLSTSEQDKPMTRILLQICQGLQYLHSKNVFHGHVFAENIWVKLDVRLGAVGDHLYNQQVLSEQEVYLAPERSATGEVSPESDVYSFGVIVLELWNWKRAKIDESSLNICDPSMSELRVEFEKMYKQCCSKNPKERPEIKALVDWLRIISAKDGSSV